MLNVNLNSSWRVQLKNVARVQKKSFNHVKKKKKHLLPLQWAGNNNKEIRYENKIKNKKIIKMIY